MIRTSDGVSVPLVSDGRGAGRCRRSGWRRSRHSRSSSSVGSRTRRFGNQIVGDSEMFHVRREHVAAPVARVPPAPAPRAPLAPPPTGSASGASGSIGSDSGVRLSRLRRHLDHQLIAAARRAGEQVLPSSADAVPALLHLNCVSANCSGVRRGQHVGLGNHGHAGR